MPASQLQVITPCNGDAITLKFVTPTWAKTCSHGDLLRVTDLIQFLKDNFDFVSIENPNRDVGIGKDLRRILAVFNLSALVVMTDFKEPNLRGGLISGNHIEFIWYNGPYKKAKQ